MKDDNSKILDTRVRISQACIAKRAKLIDCNTCSFQAVCDLIWEEKGVVKKDDDQDLLDLAQRYFL